MTDKNIAKKEKAIELMKRLDIYKPYIKGFRESDKVCGECYSFLIVSDYPEEWDDLMNDDGNRHCAYAYVWNKDDEWCSEFGDIIVQSFGGGIKRVA